MRDILFDYEMNPTTWIYLSSLMTIGIYFKFRRLWSVRNLDLLILIAFAPGLLMVSPRMAHYQLAEWGYVWLFAVGGLFLVRLLIDPMMVRRPMLEPNLSAGGLTFTGVSLLIFLMSNVVTADLLESDLEGARRLDEILARKAVTASESDVVSHGPGYPLFYLFASFSNRAFVPDDDTEPSAYRRALVRAATTRTTAILGHLAIIIGIVLIAYRHFDSIQIGIAAATLYLLLPYTAQYTARVDHVLPAAALVWAIEAYRRPVVAGIFLGLAAGVIYYPFFLLPLWCSFYWQRGLFRMLIGFTAALLVLVVSLTFTSPDLSTFLAQLKQMFGWTSVALDNVSGFWRYHQPAFRIPVVAAFVVLCGSFALWPAQKNLGTLLSCSAAVMLGTQFWHANNGGVYMAWYMPLLLLTIFRPNLEDRVALTAVTEGWSSRRKRSAASAAGRKESEAAMHKTSRKQRSALGDLSSASGLPPRLARSWR